MVKVEEDESFFKGPGVISSEQAFNKAQDAAIRVETGQTGTTVVHTTYSNENNSHQPRVILK